jgi:hypothetical protein
MFNIHNWFFGGKKQPQQKQYQFKCGHTGPLVQEVSIFGQIRQSSLKPDQLDWCNQCLAKMAILCAWCGRPIGIGEPITLYSPRIDKFVIPDHATVYSKEPLQLVGCLRMGCAETGADRAGFWMPPGEVMRVLSPFEEVMGQVERGKPSSPIIVEDLADPYEAKFIR